MRTFLKEAAVGLWLLMPAIYGYGQSPQPTHASGTNQATATFKSETRMVLIDVVVTDGSGHPIHGLKRDDFAVLEDGKPEAISAFEEQVGTDSRPASPVPVKLLANEYTNYIPAPAPSARTIVLFDFLDSSRDDLTAGRAHLIAYLKALPKGREVALYAMTEQLRLLQGFTDDSTQLVAAAETILNRPELLYTNNRELSAKIAELKESGLAKNPKAFKAAVRTLGQEDESKGEMRTQYALDVFTELARALAEVPGRKNVIWISGAFPFDQFQFERLQRVSGLLAETRIAFYPIDIRRVVHTSATGETRDSELYAPVQTQSYETLAGLSDESQMLDDTMRNVAELTGGRVYRNRNDLDHAIGDAVETGSSYYTLAYHPANRNWNGAFRKITVKTSRHGAKISYRSGYYAVADPLDTKQDPNRAEAMAMQPDVPVSTQLIMKARVVPPQEASAPVSIDMLVDASALRFNKGNDQRQTPDVHFFAIAFDENGKNRGSFSDFFQQSLTADQLHSLLTTGLQLHREITLPPGTYQIRLGIMDRLASRIGTLDVPLTIAATQK